MPFTSLPLRMVSVLFCCAPIQRGITGPPFLVNATLDVVIVWSREVHLFPLHHFPFAIQVVRRFCIISPAGP